MKIHYDKYEENGHWDTDVRGVVLYGEADGRPFGIAFSGQGLAALFGVPYEPYVVHNAFMRNRVFMSEIARDVLEAGRLEKDGTLFLLTEDLVPYFEKRAATAPA